MTDTQIKTILWVTLTLIAFSGIQITTSFFFTGSDITGPYDFLTIIPFFILYVNIKYLTIIKKEISDAKLPPAETRTQYSRMYRRQSNIILLLLIVYALILKACLIISETLLVKITVVSYFMAALAGLLFIIYFTWLNIQYVVSPIKKQT